MTAGRLHHDFLRILKKDYEAFDTPCLNSAPGRSHPVAYRSKKREKPLFKSAWIVERADGETGPVGIACAGMIAETLGIRLADRPDLTRRGETMPDGDEGHAPEARRPGSGLSGAFGENARNRPSAAVSYALDYAALLEELHAMGFRQIRQYRPRAIGIALSRWENGRGESAAVALQQAAEQGDSALYTLDSLQRLHKLCKLLDIMGAHCARHANGRSPGAAEIEAIEAKPYPARSPGEWIALGALRLPDWMSRLRAQPDPYRLQLSRTQMNFCRLLVDDLGHPGEFDPGEFEAFTHARPRRPFAPGRAAPG